MALKTLTPEQIEMLRLPLPPEAIDPHPTKPYLSTIRAPYVIERFNNVFGEAGWEMADEFVKEEELFNKDGNPSGRMVVLKVHFKAEEYGIKRWSYGGNDNPDLGDAYKGAVTDATTKIGMLLGVGMDVYKGLATQKKEGTNYVKKVEELRARDGEPACKDCGGKLVRSPKTGKDFCSNKCWLQENYHFRTEYAQSLPRPEAPNIMDIMDMAAPLPDEPF